ncbi:ABC transporter permease subunit [Actinomadura mexicana]|uniref:Amino acid/amide ABC transporter membrane protein 2, HAAT family /amino acid/amide ABC transporter ATP-binding protein 1, HAAT family n=1 Tax=Actinomadura mexicana TaxID=134959 RepID=A0A239BZV5_9ACTN|nr:branched-chain amino acid ABC transporter ATP-binding protein/permease [Actinomadura mexicana]SNS13436.1 amino acid/amide ABC transporter membrane protein 2, HAAT family /amino acid/amide ABC transporter ATP-binding protein 1, HAAT family [Actinomadura mexicana]
MADRLRSLVTGTPLLAVLGFLVVLMLPAMGLDFYWQRQVMLIAVFTLICSGLNLSFGYAGELALGQVAVFASGAYVAAVLYNHGHTDILLAFLAAVAVAAVAGLVSGIPGLRLSHWSLALVSFFFILLIPSLVSIFEEQTGGSAGLPGVIGPTIFGHQLLGPDFYRLAIAVTFVWMLVFRNMVVSRFGAMLRVLASSTTLAETMGGSVYRLRLQAYVLGALPAGIAGVLYTYMTGFISPEAFTMTLTIALLAATVLGGADSVWGAPVGAAVLVLGPLQAASFEQYSTAVYGGFLVVVGVAFSAGLAGISRRLLRGVDVRRPKRYAAADAPEAGAEKGELTIPGEQLQITGVTKAFAGLKALNGVDLTVEPGTITAIIGANGAGKTTLLNAVSGVLRPDTGSIALAGRELTGLRANKVARVGVGRTFQTPLIPSGMSVLEVVETGRLRHGGLGLIGAILRSPLFRRVRRHDREATLAALSFAGLEQRAHESAHSLPLGTRRLLEVVRAVAGEPHVLLLDEPAAGLDDDGLNELATLMRRTRDAGGTVVLVEHNVPFVMDIADHVFAMELGEVIASGAPEAVRRDRRVIDSYLGRRGEGHGPPGAAGAPPPSAGEPASSGTEVGS